MGQFLALAAVLALLAVAFAISALWKSSRRLAIALAVGIPLVAAGIYHFKGTPVALDPAMLVAADAPEGATPASMDQAIAKLRERIAADPGNVGNIALLARSYMALEQFDLAATSYQQATQLSPQDSDLAVEYAEALLRTSADRHFPPQAVQMLEAAVARNPTNQRALFFLGLHHMQNARPAEAVEIWDRLLPLLDAETGQALRKQIGEARTAAGLPPEAAGVVAATPGLTIEVQVDSSLANQVHPGDLLFVFARGATPGPPLAVKRIELDGLPARLVLTDADSPMPAARLSLQKQVTLMARLSRSGDVKAGSGDIEADPLPVEVGSNTPVTLVLRHRVP